MIKLITRISILTFIVCCATLMAKAQLGYNFSHYDIGTSVGFNSVNGDAQTTTTTASINFNFTFNYTPYTNFVLEAQLGKLAGGDINTVTQRKFNNDFTAFIFRGQLQIGELIDYERSPFMNAVKGFYVSAGVGMVANNITYINGVPNQIPGSTAVFINKTKTPFLPFRVGYEFKMYNKYKMPSVKFDLGYGYNYILGDDLDGYTIVKGHHDVYTQFTLGVKFAITGDVTSYRKQITY